MQTYVYQSYAIFVLLKRVIMEISTLIFNKLKKVCMDLTNYNRFVPARPHYGVTLRVSKNINAALFRAQDSIH